MSGLISDTVQWKRLEEHAVRVRGLHLRNLIQDSDRCYSMTAEHNGILLDYSRQLATTETIDMLFDLAAAAGLEEKRTRMGSGVHINSSEDRAVMHIALRSPRDKTFFVDGENVVPAVHSVLDRVFSFAERVRSGEWRSATNRPLVNVVSVGIGGSYLGPEFVYEALRTDPVAGPLANGRVLRFLANVDPVDVARSIQGLNPEETLIIIVSKTFTTAETMLNARTLRDWLLKAMPHADPREVLRRQVVAVSSATEKAVSFGVDPENVFGFWDWVGGRYSVSSSVGALSLSLQYSPAVFRDFLRGAHDLDSHFFSAPLRENLPVLLGLLGVWNSSFLQIPAKCLLPYSQALLKFPAHVQQLDMESNGKRVSVDGSGLPFAAGEVVFGEPGTNSQHSFFQLLHQGREVASEFLGFVSSPYPLQETGAMSNHDELMCNFFAQPDALAVGKTLAELESEGVPLSLRPHREFPGNRPSFSLLFQSLSPFSLGQLLALYEHRVSVQGFVWNINSFDQWGVELGKSLALKIRAVLKTERETERGETQSEAMKTLNPSTRFLLSKYLSK